MYLYIVTIKESIVHGKGVFTLEPIAEHSIVWRFEKSHDKTLSLEDFEKLSSSKQEEIQKIGYISKKSNRWIYPPVGDPARFTNHSAKANNLDVVLNSDISPEPYFRANRDISTGEELLVNYLEFDEYTITAKPHWI